MPSLPVLDSTHPVFPCPDTALENPNGLLAIGGNLSQKTLYEAYRQGIFPWYDETQPLLWWSPNPRAVIFPKEIRISRSLKKTMRQKSWEIRLNTDFQSVVEQCAAPRRHNEMDTWITDDMQNAYLALHHAGLAHSLEVWLENQLVGGLYGVFVGSVFCGESMFSLQKDASKVALVQLSLLIKQYTVDGFIDCQVSNDHLISMGAVTIPRQEFLSKLSVLREQSGPWPDKWQFKIPEQTV
ncbi:MAG: leucyl/phenylalanyl-tRNA--protein transferase [Porticoccus sp.]|nr:leucyl/phenylalanyl-tRNA--protein transferase [Porticoccus sp.]